MRRLATGMAVLAEQPRPAIQAGAVARVPRMTLFMTIDRARHQRAGGEIAEPLNFPRHEARCIAKL
jgi:hypothetical protein